MTSIYKGHVPNRIRRICRAFTLVELLIVIAIFILLMGLLAPAIQSARHTTRRIHCANNLKQISIAIHGYHNSHAMLPPGTLSGGFGFHFAILPFIEQYSLHDSFDISQAYDDAINVHVAKVIPSLYLCPSDSHASGQRPRGTNYAGNTGTGVQARGFDGTFRHLMPFGKYIVGPLRLSDITDGLSQTAMVSETLTGNGSDFRIRVTWNTAAVFNGPDELLWFRDYCNSHSHVLGDRWMKGTPWTAGQPGFTLYNHVNRPNRSSCMNGASVQTGVYAASSMHPSGVNVVCADGHVVFESNEIDYIGWRAMGSRSEGD